MLNIFLSYARADGAAAAESLHKEVTQMGFSVWQDVQQMRGGKAWREQLHDALHTVDALLALLTPGYVASCICTWEWQAALARNKRVVPLLIAPCDIPAELARLHYHNLSELERYPLGLATLARDLIELLPVAPPQPAAGAGAKYSIVGNRNTIIGEGATVIRVSGGNANALLQNILSTLAQLRAGAGLHQAEFDAALREISARLGALK